MYFKFSGDLCLLKGKKNPSITDKDENFIRALNVFLVHKTLTNFFYMSKQVKSGGTDLHI